MFWMFGALIILNFFNVLELYHFYDREVFNAPYVCTFEEGLLDGMIAEECVVYFELMGACTAVFLSMLFINVAVIRSPKPQNTGKKLKDFGQGREYSLRDLQTLANDPKARKGVKTYYKYAIDVIQEVRESEAPLYMPNAWYEWKWCSKCCCIKCCRCRCLLPSLAEIVRLVSLGMFIGLLTLVSLYTHPDEYLNAMGANWGHSASVVISYLVVVVFLFCYLRAMWLISMMFRKAYALMKISSNPGDFIENFSQDTAAAQDGRAQSPDHISQLKQQRETFSDLLEKVRNGMEQRNDEMNEAIESLETKVKQLMKDRDGEARGNGALKHYLNERMKIVDPNFVRAWSTLREHIQRWELQYFYEVCSHRIHITLHFNAAGDIWRCVSIFNGIEINFRNTADLHCAFVVSRNSWLNRLYHWKSCSF